jgi:hypothetical protein
MRLLRHPDSFRGKKESNGRYCNARCQNSGALMALSHQIPYSTVHEQILRYWTEPLLAFRKCALKQQAKSAGLSLVAGWWGFAGVILTPIQLGRNIFAMLRPPDPMQPSAKLEKTVRVTLASDAIRKKAAAEWAASKPLWGEGSSVNR